MANACRVRYLAFRMEQGSIGQVKRLTPFHCQRHPSERRAYEVLAILTAPAMDRQVEESIQIQSHHVIVFMYRIMLQ